MRTDTDFGAWCADFRRLLELNGRSFNEAMRHSLEHSEDLHAYFKAGVSPEEAATKELMG